jgi:UDP:flavonoid glycosyltransferase YjiC (YdhE family)
MAFDQHVWAADVVRLGVGTSLPEEVSITQETVIAAVDDALNEGVAEAAKGVAQKLGRWGTVKDGEAMSGVHVAAKAVWAWLREDWTNKIGE